MPLRPTARNGTRLQAAVQAAVDRSVPVGGTSAGEAILTEHVFTAAPALDANAILTPPCIFHWRFSIQNIIGGAPE